MYIYIQRVVIALIFLVLFVAAPKPSLAIRYSLNLVTQGALTRGQEIQFAVTIDSQGASLTSAQIGIQYQTQYLQYTGIVPGNAMSSVQVQDLGGGKFIISGSNPPGFSGTDTFASLNFKIIADAPGSSELCTFFEVSPTPPASTTAPAPTTPAGTLPTAPVPTRLPKTGYMDSTNLGAAVGIFLLIGAATVLSFTRKPTVSNRHRKK